MSAKEQVKFDLDFLKGLIFACLGAIFGIVGYAIINIETLTRKQIIFRFGCYFNLSHCFGCYL